MTKKNIREIEKIVEKVLHDMISEPSDLTLQGNEEAMFSIAILEEMENYLGHSIDFMGIS